MRMFYIVYTSGRETNYCVPDHLVSEEIKELRELIRRGIVKSYDHKRVK